MLGCASKQPLPISGRAWSLPFNSSGKRRTAEREHVPLHYPPPHKERRELRSGSSMRSPAVVCLLNNTLCFCHARVVAGPTT